MSGQHTPGKVRLHSKYPQDVVTDDGMYTLARTLPQPTIAVAEANARRIVACWNMLSGDTTEDIEANVLPDALDLLETHIGRMQENLATITANYNSLLDQAQELHRQRDMLLTALTFLCSRIEVDGATPLDSAEYRQARAAIAKAEGAA